jgi:hypothetical protein
MNTKIVGGLIEQFIIQGMIDVLHKEINLMRHTPDAYELDFRLVINLCYYTNVSPCHHVLAIGAKSNNPKLLMCIQCI